MWDRSYSVRVRVPGDAYDQTCGICGVYNDNPDDDWVMGPAEDCMPEVDFSPGDLVNACCNIMHAT